MTTNNIKTNHKIIRGDSRRMKELADNSTHLVITSPPYWQLKDYGTTNQIGYHDSYENYINNLNLVWQECFRVLENGCRLCINIGDQFARSVYYGRYKVIPIRTEIIKFCETIGFDYMGSVIWQKSTTMNTTGGATIMGSFPYPRNGIIKLDYEFILIFKKNGEPQKLNKELKELSKLTKEEWNLYFQGHWRFNGVRQDDHIAMFPEELPKRLIKMFSFVGDTIIDPFMGSGTTSLAAKNLGRNSVGYEINPKFIDIIKQKLEVNVNKMFDNSTELVGSIIVLQKSANKTIEDSILKLVEQEGKDINNCKVIKWDGESKNEEFRVTLITPISEFSFTEEEIKIIEEADKNPDGPIDGKFERQLIYNKHAIELCSHYADPLNLGTCSNFGNIFLYNELKSKTKFLFLSPTNCDPYFYKYNTIELL